MIDMQNSVLRFSLETEVTHIQNPGSYVNSVWVPGTQIVTTRKCVMRPVDGRTRNAMPEGVRTLAQWVCHALFDIKTTVAGTGVYGDQIVFQGKTYNAISIDDSFGTHGEYTRVALTELEN